MGTATRTGRRAGYLLGVLINLALLFVVNIWPGWQAVPFLTPAAADLVVPVNVSLILGVVANLIYVVRDPAWLKALGDLLTTAISLAVVIGTLKVFPFDFGDSTVDWDLWVRILLGFLIAALGIALIVQITTLVRAAIGGPQTPN